MTTGRINQVAFLFDITAGNNASAMLPRIIPAARVVSFYTGLHKHAIQGQCPHAERFLNPNSEHKHPTRLGATSLNWRLVATNKHKLHGAPTDITMPG